MNREPIGTGRLPPLGDCRATISRSIGADLPIPQKPTLAHGAMVAGLVGGNSLRNGIAPAKPATIAPWPGWVFEGSGDLPRCLRDGGLATAECREPVSSDRLPVHRSESPTGYSSAGCSPAEPASASPVSDNSSLIPIRCLAVIQALVCVRRHRGCHLYFAHRVTFLSCADIACKRKRAETSR